MTWEDGLMRLSATHQEVVPLAQAPVKSSFSLFINALSEFHVDSLQFIRAVFLGQRSKIFVLTMCHDLLFENPDRPSTRSFRYWLC